MNKSKKYLIIALSCAAAVLAVAAGIWFFRLKDYISAANASPVYVNQISSIIGLNTGTNPRYSGIVEPQQTYKINKDESRTVAEIYVNEGDEVYPGMLLFRYDTQDLKWALDQANIDKERIASQITTLKSQLSALQADKKKADKDEQAAFTLQIQAKELEIKTEEYNSTQKQSEIDKLKDSIANCDVVCEFDGIVKEISANGQQDSNGQQKPFISILSSGEYRVKGTVSELNFSSLSVGQAVVVHSRIDSAKTWKGTVESIDTETVSDQDNNFGYYYGGDSSAQSSKYNFYVVLENPVDLILGQHVYIEPDLGDAAQKVGLWLPAMYIAHDDDGSFVWAQNEKGRLEKRDILLGEYDKDTDTYEIKGGVTKTDSIAYPSDTLKAGMPTTVDAAYMDSYTGAYDDIYSDTYDDSYSGETDGEYGIDTGELFDEDFGVEAYGYDEADSGITGGEDFVE